MVIQFDNLLLSSLVLYYENKILDKGTAYTNIVSPFYATSGDVNGLFAYAAPFKPFVADHSITNAIKISGVYVGNTFHLLGSGGVTGINFAEGLVYLTGAATGTISGSYSVQDFYVSATSRPDDELLFERKYQIRPKTITQSGTAGLLPSEYTVPSIFFKNDKSVNKEFAFGGVEDTRSTINCIVIADSQFLLDAAVGIIRDTSRDYIPEIVQGEMPFNLLGSYINNTQYNYDTITNGKLAAASGYYIQDVDVMGFTNNLKIVSEIKNINPKIYVSFLTIETSKIRQPRVC